MHRIWNPGGARTVLLLHGLGSSPEADFPEALWREALTAVGWRAVLVALPGHGSPGVPASLGTLLDDIAELADGPADTVAWSLGARIAWTLCESGRVDGAAVLGGLSAQDPLAAADWSKPQDGEGLEGMLHAVTQRAQQPHDTLELAQVLGGSPFTPGRLDAHTLLVRGTEDPIAADSAALLIHLPRGRLLDIPGDHATALASSAFRDAAVSHLTSRHD